MSFDLNRPFENRNTFPQEELARYHGLHVAWNLEGTQIVASGKDDLEVFQAVQSAGLDPAQVVFSYVPFADEIFIK